MENITSLYRSMAGTFILLFSVTSLALAQATVYNIKKYGAKGDIWLRPILTGDSNSGSVII